MKKPAPRHLPATVRLRPVVTYSTAEEAIAVAKALDELKHTGRKVQ